MQFAARVAVPLLQLAARQVLPAGTNWLAGQVTALPLHTSCSSHTPPDARHTVLAAKGKQRPSLPRWLQVWQSLGSLLPQAVPQHTPSAQKPLSHALDTLQARPSLILGSQTPALHQLPDRHWLSMVQPPEQNWPAHKLLAQVRV